MICLAPYPPQEYDIQFPYKILEYWACKKPIITTKTVATEKYVSNEEDGLLIEFDRYNLSSSIRRLFLDKELRQRLGSKGYNKSRNFTWDDLRHKFESVLL